MPLAGQLTALHGVGAPGRDATLVTQLAIVNAVIQHTTPTYVIYVTCEDARGGGDQESYSRIRRRPTIIFWISDVPSPMSNMGASRYSLSISYSVEYP